MLLVQCILLPKYVGHDMTLDNKTLDNKTKKECRRDSPSLAAILIPCIQTLKGSGVTFLLPSSGQKDLQVHVKPIILIQQPHWDFFHFSDFLPKMNSTMSPRKHEDVVCKSARLSFESRLPLLMNLCL